MYDLQLDTDEPLAHFINNYVEQELDSVERSVLEEYLSAHSDLAHFVRKSEKGKRALRNAYQVKAAPDFEEKLFNRIENDKKQRNCSEFSGAC